MNKGVQFTRSGSGRYPVYTLMTNILTAQMG